jgi:hypothetical protein
MNLAARWQARMGRWSPLLAALSIFALNAWICRELFGVRFSRHMESIEGGYMTISRWAMAHWSDLSWFPFWFGGMPFRSVYQPGLHLSVAALATVARLTPERAYHVLTAIAYCAGPFTLFVLCYGLTKRWIFASISGLLYSLVSPVWLLSAAIRSDTGDWGPNRRYQILIHYGEGPHTAALALIPLAILALHRGITLGRRGWLAFAPLAIASVALTNWPGSVGLSMAILAYSISHLDSWRRTQWLSLIGVAIIAYFIAAPSMPPSSLLGVLTNAQQSDATRLGVMQIAAGLVCIAVLCLLNRILARRGCDRAFRFFAFFAVVTGAVSVGYLWFGWRFLPQPGRFQMEFDMACAGAAAWVMAWILRSAPRPLAIALVAVLLATGVTQAKTYRRYARRQTGSTDITSTTEYQMSSAFEANFPGQRVFAPGNVALWMNMFNDEPQLAGCCDQSIPSSEYRIAVFAIYTGLNMGAREAEIATLWLRAYGANAIGTTGPNSTEYFKPFSNWRKFDGVLSEVWRSGDNVIYRVPRKSSDLVRVIPRVAVMSRAPQNGLDIEPVQKLVEALEDPSAPAADFRWVSAHEASIHASTRSKDVIFLQVSWSRGWRAIENGVSWPIHPDPLGLMYVEPGKAGDHHIRLIYEGGREAEIASLLRLGGLGMVALIALAGPLLRD